MQQFDEHFAACGIVGHHVARFAHRLLVGVGRSDVDFARAFKAVAHRGATGLKTEHFNVHDVFAIERHQMLDGAHELHRRHAVSELIVHHLRDRQGLDSVFKGLLQGVLDGHTGTNARVYQLFVLAVVDTLEFRNVRRDAQGGHLLCQSGRGLAFGVQTHAHRHEALFEFLVRALFEHFGNQNAHATGCAVGLDRTFFSEHRLRGKRLVYAGGKGFGQLFESLRRELFGLQFNK